MLRHAALLFLTLSLPTPALAQDGLADARNALARVDVVGCIDQAGFTPGEVRVAVVVYPDGVWSLAFGPIGSLEAYAPSQAAAAEQCVQTALGASLASPVAHPPRAASVVARVVTVPSGAEREVDARLRLGQSAIDACVGADPHAPHGALTVRLHVEQADDGTARVTGRGRGGPLVARCVASTLGALPVGTPTVDREITVVPTAPVVSAPVDPGPRPDGREGAICGWGQRRADWMTLPDPMVCRPGLSCCSAGGAAGSDAICMRVSTCPAYP